MSASEDHELRELYDSIFKAEEGDTFRYRQYDFVSREPDTFDMNHTFYIYNKVDDCASIVKHFNGTWAMRKDYDNFKNAVDGWLDRYEEEK